VKASELLHPGLLAQLERLQVNTRQRLAGRFSGEHRSRAYGASVDFADYREYHPGDDYRRIDYPLFARTGHLFIRLFEAEDDVTVRIVVDRSASMGMFGKLDQAVRMAAAIGFVALLRRDTVVVQTMPQLAPPRRFRGRHATQPLFEMLASLEAAGPTDLAAAATSALGQRTPAGVTVVISDLLSATWSPAIDRLAAGGGELTMLHVLAADELRPDLRGDLEIVDVETGATVPASLSPAARRDYEQHVTAWLAATSEQCRRRGATYVRVMAEDAPEDVLLRAWRRQGVLR
jgi:uncharacterized protein (DUF58 family)